jgi:hypothetical protein
MSSQRGPAHTRDPRLYLLLLRIPASLFHPSKPWRCADGWLLDLVLQQESRGNEGIEENRATRSRDRRVTAFRRRQQGGSRGAARGRLMCSSEAWPAEPPPYYFFTVNSGDTRKGRTTTAIAISSHMDRSACSRSLTVNIPLDYVERKSKPVA